MDKTSTQICNLLSSEKKQNELYVGVVSHDWEYMVVSYVADCTEALPLTLLDKTICGILDLDGKMSFSQLGLILGLNVNDAPDEGDYRDAAEASLLHNAIQSLLEFNMVERDFEDETINLTDIGREYYHQGKKFRTSEEKSFNVYFDRTTGAHGKAKKLFSKASGSPGSIDTPVAYTDETFLKSFIHEQIPSIYDPVKGNSFTNLSYLSPSKLIRVPVQVGVLYDISTQEFRYIAVLEDRISPTLNDIIASDEQVKKDLELKVNAKLAQSVCSTDKPIQEAFENALRNTIEVEKADEGLSAMIPLVMEKEEFWQALPLLIGEDETSVFIRVGHVGHDEFAAIVSFCEKRPSTNVFLSFSECTRKLPQRFNLFYIQEENDGDYLLCTPTDTYGLRGYVLHRPTGDVSASMVYHYPGTERDSFQLRGPFAFALLSKTYTETMSFLEKDFDCSKSSLKSISRCDNRVNVFEDFLSEEHLSLLRTKKQEVFNRVKIAYEQELLDKLDKLIAEKDLEDVVKSKELEEIAGKVEGILKEGDETYLSLMERGRDFQKALKERERTIKDELLSKTYIVDTNVFLKDPEILSKIKRPNRVVLSGQVLQELDRKKNKTDDPELAANARKAVGAINTMKEKDRKAKKKFLIMDWADMSLLPEELQTRKGDNFILGVAMKYRDANPWLITSDHILTLTAESLGIPTVSMEDFYTKNGLNAPVQREGATRSETSMKYMEVYHRILEKKGFVLLNVFENECKKVGITSDLLGYGTFYDFIVAAPEFARPKYVKGKTYVNLKRNV